MFKSLKMHNSRTSEACTLASASVNKTIGRRRLVVLATAAAMVPFAASGADTWDNSSGDGKWSTASNWADDTEPTLADAVIFPTPAPGGLTTIIPAPGENAQSLTFNDVYNVVSAFEVGSVNL